ncbi:MAG: sialate O-acetylesterase [Bacteroidota bacterium]
MKSILHLAFIVLFTHHATAQESTLALARIFSDNLVLQQKSEAPVWGKGTPGEYVSVTASWGKNSKGIVQPDSSWMVKIKTPKAGGPYTLSISSDNNTKVLNNIMIGEVWLCSGQSNMEMPLEGWMPENPIDHSESEIHNAAYPGIRFFTVEHAISLQPNDTCVGAWKECTPEAAAKFSATAFFFGKKLHRELNVPIGLIFSAWGGTPAQAWTSEKFITQHPNYTNLPAQLAHAEAEFSQYMEWLTSHAIIDISGKSYDEACKGLQFNDTLLALSNFNDSSWREMKLPAGWEGTEVGTFDGVIWFRKKVEIPKQWMNQELIMELGPIDDHDLAFINGKLVGGLETGSSWNVNRVYSIPAEAVQESVITIAIRVIDLFGGGGFWGRPEQMQIRVKNGEDKMSLVGNWNYMPIAEFRDSKFYIFDAAAREYYSRPPLVLEISSQTPTALYNGMIAPLVPYAIKGAIWYQGEANTEDPEAYSSLFPLMIKNWRHDWNNNFSFYFVQIAPFNYGAATESQRLREAQMLTLSLPKTGMAVTLDIGNATNIHPSNKTDVGERLARWALVKDYGKKIPFSGPLLSTIKIKKDAVILSFDHAEGLNIKSSNSSASFQIAGEDSVFKDALVAVKGKTLIVRSPDGSKPLAVRYAWDNVAEATLFNKAGLPAPSFRTDRWQK